MSWKKNVFSYIMWTVYLLGAACCFLSYGQRLVEGFGLRGSGAILAAGIGGILCLGVIFFLLRLAQRKMRERGSTLVIPWEFLEWGLTVCLLLAGIILRVLLLPDTAGTSDYMNAARVTEGGSVPQITHGAVYFYLQLLHFFFRLFGNNWLVGVWLQIVLQMAGSVLLYLGVRKIAGGFPAIALLAAMMLLPGQLDAGMSYAPDMLYLCFYALGLLFASRYLQKACSGGIKKIYQLFPLILAGVYLAFVTYLDISGVSLLILILSVLNANRRENKSQYGKLYVQLLVLAGSFLLGFLVCIAADALGSGTLLPGVWKAWIELYRVKGQDFFFWMNEKEVTLHFIVNGLMILGAFGFWCREDKEQITPWVMMMCSFSVIEFLHISAERMNSLGLLFYVSVIACGIGLLDCLGMEGNLLAVSEHGKTRGKGQGEEKEKSGKEKADKETSAKEKADREVIGKDKTDRGTAGKDKAGRETTGKDRAVKERFGKDRLDQEKPEKAGSEKENSLELEFVDLTYTGAGASREAGNVQRGTLSGRIGDSRLPEETVERKSREEMPEKKSSDGEVSEEERLFGGKASEEEERSFGGKASKEDFLEEEFWDVELSEEPLKDEIPDEELSDDSPDDETTGEELSEEPLEAETPDEELADELLDDEISDEKPSDELLNDEALDEEVSEDDEKPFGGKTSKEDFLGDEFWDEELSDEVLEDGTSDEELSDEALEDGTSDEELSEETLKDETPDEELSEEPLDDEALDEELSDELQEDEAFEEDEEPLDEEELEDEVLTEDEESFGQSSAEESEDELPEIQDEEEEIFDLEGLLDDDDRFSQDTGSGGLEDEEGSLREALFGEEDNPRKQEDSLEYDIDVDDDDDYDLL